MTGGPPEIDRDQIAESDEFRRYTEKLLVKLPNYARRAAGVAPEAPGSIEWLMRTGKFWWEAREEAGLSRHQMAEKIGIDIDDLRFAEMGLPEPGVWQSEFPKRYADALGQPTLYDAFCERFNLPKIIPPKP